MINKRQRKAKWKLKFLHQKLKWQNEKARPQVKKGRPRARGLSNVYARSFRSLHLQNEGFHLIDPLVSLFTVRLQNRYQPIINRQRIKQNLVLAIMTIRMQHWKQDRWMWRRQNRKRLNTSSTLAESTRRRKLPICKIYSRNMLRLLMPKLFVFQRYLINVSVWLHSRMKLKCRNVLKHWPKLNWRAILLQCRKWVIVKLIFFYFKRLPPLYVYGNLIFWLLFRIRL